MNTASDFDAETQDRQLFITKVDVMIQQVKDTWQTSIGVLQLLK